MQLDNRFRTGEACRAACCRDEWCEIWQFTKTGTCWRGRSNDCRRDIAGATDVVVSQRVH
jgi:hypothetical protein